MEEFKKDSPVSDAAMWNRWRLVLGNYAKDQLPYQQDAGQLYQQMDDALDFLYRREYGEGSGVRGRGDGDGDGSDKRGGRERSNPGVVTWLNKIRKLFSKQTVEILERHALDRYGMNELVTDKEVLQRMEPNQELLKTILSLKHMMKGDVLDTAKRIVRQVAEDLMKKLESEVRQSIVGKVDRSRSSRIKCAANLDFKKTIRRNLKNYDTEKHRLVLENVYFSSRVKKYNTWNVILCVDESGSMMDSIIHSAVMAGIFAKLPMLRTKFVIFSTDIVDLSGIAADPVELLMSVQLGGGTDIAGALRYCEQLVENPHRTILVLVTDLYEGGGYQNMYAVSRGILESGVKFVILPALDEGAEPAYDKQAAKQLAGMGAHVAAMTPEALADWIGTIIK